MFIYLNETCDLFDYVHKITVADFKTDTKTKGNSIIISYNNKHITIPLANIVAMEEEE